MGRSTRFPVAVHILAVLAIEPSKHVSSELIAKSVGTNSVVVRRVLSQLQKAGLVASQAGVGGGARLNVDPQQVSLLDVYDAVEGACLFPLHEAHPNCPVAITVKDGLERTIRHMVDRIRCDLSSIALEKLTRPAVREYRKSLGK